jgi:hypothetical protein
MKFIQALKKNYHQTRPGKYAGPLVAKASTDDLDKVIKNNFYV